MLPLQNYFANLHQLFRGIIIEMENIRKPALHSRICLQHSVHLLCITGKYDYHVSIVRAKSGKQRFYHSHSEVFPVSRLHKKVISLIDKQHTTTGTFYSTFGILLRSTYPLAHQFGSLCLNHVS